jgi:hypothetical protein
MSFVGFLERHGKLPAMAPSTSRFGIKPPLERRAEETPATLGEPLPDRPRHLPVRTGDRFPSKPVVLLDQGSEIWKTKDYIECY